MNSGSNALRGDVTVLFGETNQQLKLGLRQALRAAGYTRLREVSADTDVRSFLALDYPDIAILDVGLPGDIATTTRDLRHARLGINPFVPTILTSWVGEADIIRKLLNTGADEILLKPLSVAALMERIDSLVLRRKPYLATQDYIGPDRRGGRADPNAPDVNLIHPPNTLKAKLEGHPLSKEDLLAQIQQSNVAMQEQRLMRDIARVSNLSQAVADALSDGRRDQKLFAELDQLVFLGRDLGLQIKGTPFAQVLPVMESLSRTAAALRDGLPELDEKRVKLLPSLADAVSTAVGSPEARRYIAEIAAMVRLAKPSSKAPG
jgi:DNA-binding response OmpR family regulator